jgi:hypothetical protein
LLLDQPVLLGEPLMAGKLDDRLVEGEVGGRSFRP